MDRGWRRWCSASQEAAPLFPAPRGPHRRPHCGHPVLNPAGASALGCSSGPCPRATSVDRFVNLRVTRPLLSRVVSVWNRHRPLSETRRGSRRAVRLSTLFAVTEWRSASSRSPLSSLLVGFPHPQDLQPQSVTLRVKLWPVEQATFFRSDSQLLERVSLQSSPPRASWQPCRFRASAHGLTWRFPVSPELAGSGLQPCSSARPLWLLQVLHVST